MSAATVFDTTASYPIRFDEPRQKEERKSRWHSVRYNHLPRSKSGRDFAGKLKPGGKASEAVLSLRDGDDAYSYRGHSREEKGSYVLVLKGEGDDKEMVLERVDGAWAFNLTSQPGEQDARKLEQKYPAITLDEEVQKAASTNGKATTGDDAGEADDANPYDYRHFLKAQAQAPVAPARPAGSGFNTPQSTASPRPTTKPAPSAARKQPEPAQKKRKTAPAAKPASSASKTTTTATQEKRPVDAAPASAKTRKESEEVPRLHLDRKASIKPSDNKMDADSDHNNDDDDGELILENDTPTEKAPARHTNAMALALGGQLGTSNGRTPMSLHSAVSSPGSRINSASPMPQPQREEYEFDFGNDSDGEAEQDDNEDDADADVEDLELPSPAAGRGFSGQARAVGGGGGGHVEAEGEEEDDLEKQMMMAMAEEAPPPASAGVVEDESEESEEE